MYIDRLDDFRILVKDLVSRSEELGLVIPAKDKTRILSHKSPLSRQADSIVTTVRSLSEMLHEHKTGYLESKMVHGTSSMSDTERNQVNVDFRNIHHRTKRSRINFTKMNVQVDAGADSIAKQCRSLIARYREDVNKSSLSSSAHEHHTSVCSGLENFLQSVVSYHSEMRAVRVSRQLEMKRLSRLEVTSVESRAQEIGASAHAHQGAKEQERELREKAISAAAVANRSSAVWDEDGEEEEMSPEEANMMEMENEKLIDHLSSLTNQVDQVQSKVVKIAELQSIFTEKVLQQAESLEKVAEEAVSTTENVKEGNEAIRQAIQNKASYRVYILFIILVFSFSLLFLDWYNP